MDMFIRKYEINGARILYPRGCSRKAGRMLKSVLVIGIIVTLLIALTLRVHPVELLTSIVKRDARAYS
eukprot:4252-Pleurochrysis_carterae.AAC.1